jgi:hypothetical protein
VGFGPVFFPSERSLGHGSIDALPFPLNAFEFVVFLQSHPPNGCKEFLANQKLKVAMQATSRTKLARCRFPLTAGPQHIKNTVEDLPPLQRLSAWMSSSAFMTRQQWIQAFPECIGDPPLIVDTLAILCHEPDLLDWVRLDYPVFLTSRKAILG